MTKTRILQCSIVFFAFTFALSCGNDDETVTPTDVCDNHTATYDGDVKAIIDATCAYAGCHDGTGANPVIPANAIDYTSYAGLQIATGGAFNQRTLVDKDMPPADFVPPGFASELTDEQLEILTCWHDAGYPEN